MNEPRLANKPIYITPSLHEILKNEAKERGMTLAGLAEQRLSKSLPKRASKNGRTR